MTTATEKRPRIAVVDDEPQLLATWKRIAADRYDVLLFADPIAAKVALAEQRVDLALLDVRMPGMDGLSLLAHLRREQPELEVIMVSGVGDVATAVEAMKFGAYDYITKPLLDIHAVLIRIDAAIERKRLREVNARLREQLASYSGAHELVGVSEALSQIRSFVTRIADSPAPVLISGESGTGKEVVARAIYGASPRATKPFIAINCGALPETLIDSELFGHEKGAFTGASTPHKGLFEAADGGTLFLDEIGDMPLSTQVRLLRVLQEGEVRPVGATKNRPVNVRLIAATHVDLERAIAAGTFREDLYYRINTFRVDIPPLRKRRDDIPVLAQTLLRKYTERAGIAMQDFSDDALEALLGFSWPGNVRQLSSVVEYAATLAGGGSIAVEHLPSFVTAERGRAPTRNGTAAVTLAATPYQTARAQVMSDFEERYLKELMAATSGNLSDASRRSGIDRSNLRRMVRRLNIDPEVFRGEGGAVAPVEAADAGSDDETPESGDLHA